MKRDFIEEVKMGSGFAFYMLTPSNGGAVQYREEMKYILTHRLKTINDLDFYISCLIVTTGEEEYYHNFLKEELFNNKVSVDGFYNIVTQLSYFVKKGALDTKELLIEYTKKLINDTKVFRRKEISKLDILLKVIQEDAQEEIVPILKLIVDHNSFKKFDSLFRLEFMDTYYDVYLNAKIDDEYIFGKNRKSKMTRYIKKYHQNEYEEYCRQIDETIKEVGNDEIKFDDLENLDVEKRNYLFECIKNESYSLDAKIALMMYINLYVPLTKKQRIELIDLFYEHIGENRDFDLLILSEVRFIRNSKVRKLAKYLIKNGIYLEEAASLLAYNLKGNKDSDTLFDLVNNFDYSDYYNNQLEIIEISILRLFYCQGDKIPNIDEFYPFELIRYMFDRTINARLRHDMAVILDQKDMLSEEDYYVLAFDSTMDVSDYFRNKTKEKREEE